MAASSVPETSPTHPTVYVQVDDLHGSSRRAETLRAEILVPPNPIPGVGATALLDDPEGNTVGLFTGQTAS